MIDKSKVKVGSDFELFLVNKDGAFVSAIPYNEGTKDFPERLAKAGCCVQRDGNLQEFNVPPVGLDGADEFFENVNYVLNFQRDRVEKHGLRLVCCASGTYEKTEMKNPEARALGCDPDYNAWNDGEVNAKPRLKNKNFRSCGGHIHLSYPDANYDTSMEIIRLCDLYLGVPSVLLDEDTERRKLYGKAGAFRPQAWENAAGVEYRVLSNFWIEDLNLVSFVFTQLSNVFDHVNGKGSINEDSEKIIKAINETDRILAEELCVKYNLNLPIEYAIT